MRRFLLATVAASAFALAPMLATAQTSPNPALPDAYEEPATPGVPNDGAPPGAPPAMPPADQPVTPGPNAADPVPAAPEAQAAPTPAAPAPAAPAITASACQAQNTTVYFNSGSVALDDRAETAITQPISAAGCTVSEVRIAGFADQRGADSLNLAISQRRAEAVRDLLVAQGIAADKIEIDARGETAATGDDTTDRRAEVQLVFANTAATASLAPSPAPYASNTAPGVDLNAPTTTAEADTAMAAEPAAPVEPSDAPAQSAALDSAQTAEEAMASANAMTAEAGAVPETTQTAANVCAAPREIAVDFTGTSNALSAPERTELESAVSAVSACEIQAVTIAAAPEGDARAGAVRDVLVAEGVPAAVISVAEEAEASPTQVAVEMRFAGPSAG